MAADETPKPEESGAAKGAQQPDGASGPADADMAEDALRAAKEAIADLGGVAASAANTAGAPVEDAGGAAQAYALPAFEGVSGEVRKRGIDLLADVNLNVKIELGRTRMYVEDVLQLGEGAVVELDKLAGDPVDIFVNDRLVARGEVLVLNDNFCVRINEIVGPVGEPAAA